MRILVTGGTGFLGKAVAFKLAKDGHEVTAIGRNEEIGKELRSWGIGFVKIDLADANAVMKVCQNQNGVVHCGALASPWGKYIDFYKSNVLGTQHIILGCEKHGVERMIHVSTPSIYMEYRDRYQIKESEPLPVRAVNLYAQTKRMAEEIVDTAYLNGLSVITIRPRGIFGPEDHTIFPRIIRVNDSRGIPDFGKSATVDITYIDNVVDAVVLCLHASKKSFGKKYNITNGEPRQLKALLQALFDKLGYPLRFRKMPFRLAYCAAALAEFYAKFMPGADEPEITRYGVGTLYYAQTLDITVAQQDLGFKPRIDIDKGMERFADWWRESL